MAWPDAIYKIIIDGGGGLLTAIVILALFTDFWNNLFNRGKERVEVNVIPERLVSDIQEVIDEMRECAGSIGASNSQLIDWAKAIDDAIHED